MNTKPTVTKRGKSTTVTYKRKKKLSKSSKYIVSVEKTSDKTVIKYTAKKRGKTSKKK